MPLSRDGEQCERHSDVVVEVAFGAGGAELRLQHSVYQLFGGGFAVGAGDADDGNVELLAVLLRQFLERFQRVVHHDAVVVAFQLAVFGHHEGRAVFEGLQGELVAVEVLALEAEEETVGHDGASVGAYHGMLEVGVV